MPKAERWLGLMVCFAGLICWGGCGGGDGLDRVAVSGTVTLNGSPLEQGRIAFMPLESTPGPATGAAVENGRFVLPREQGPVRGTHRVEVIATRSTGRQIEEGPGSDHPDRLVDEVEQYIPDTYNRRSTLTVDLASESPENQTFELTIAQ